MVRQLRNRFGIIVLDKYDSVVYESHEPMDRNEALELSKKHDREGVVFLTNKVLIKQL